MIRTSKSENNLIENTNFLVISLSGSPIALFVLYQPVAESIGQVAQYPDSKIED